MVIHLLNAHLTDSFSLFLTAQYHDFWSQHRKVVWSLRLYNGSGGPAAIVYTALSYPSIHCLMLHSWHTWTTSIKLILKSKNYILCNHDYLSRVAPLFVLPYN